MGVLGVGALPLRNERPQRRPRLFHSLDESALTIVVAVDGFIDGVPGGFPSAEQTPSSRRTKSVGADDVHDTGATAKNEGQIARTIRGLHEFSEETAAGLSPRLEPTDAAIQEVSSAAGEGKSRGRGWPHRDSG